MKLENFERAHKLCRDLVKMKRLLTHLEDQFDLLCETERLLELGDSAGFNEVYYFRGKCDIVDVLENDGFAADTIIRVQAYIHRHGLQYAIDKVLEGIKELESQFEEL